MISSFIKRSAMTAVLGMALLGPVASASAQGPSRHRQQRVVRKAPPARTTVVVRTAPPPRRAERVRPARRGYVWVAGYWRHDGRRFVWVRGHYVRAKRGYTYTPARWQPQSHGWVYVPGHYQRVR